MQPWPVLACNVVSHAMLIGTKIALTNFVRNASSGTAVSASIKTSALSVMLLIAANVVNLTLAITATNMDALTPWRYDHAPFVTLLWVCSHCYDTEGFGTCKFCGDAFFYYHGLYCNKCNMMACKYCKDWGAMCNGHHTDHDNCL